MLTAIICTYNRAKYIGNLLESIAANDLPKSEYEVLLVDNNCTDNTQEICEAFTKVHPDIQFHYTHEPEQGLSAARNKGIKEAHGDILVYIDDDALVDTHYLRTYADWFAAHPETMACGGPIEPLYETAEPDWMTSYTRALLCAWMNYGSKVRAYPRGRYPGGGNAVYRKSVFEKVGLFNTALGRKGGNLMGSEEKDIFDKMHTLGMQVLYLPTPVLHHIIPQSKLERPYFDRLTLQMGISERQRTLSIGIGKHLKRIFAEVIKWMGTIVLFCGYTLQLHPAKGIVLLRFRYNVTRGLLGIVKSVP